MTNSQKTRALLQSIKVGSVELKHRAVMAPLTRFKATEKEHVPTPIMKEYYSQRGSTPGTLLITEATFIAAKAGGYTHVPGIWSQDQIKAWKEITDAVHAKGSFMYMQLWALGRAAKPQVLQAEDPNLSVVSASNIPMPGGATPRPLTIDEIQEYTSLYAAAARNAIAAGFDGVEIHGANGYLVDQFIQDVSNKRTDAYGGSIENRARFALEVIEKVVQAVGPERTAIRLSPWRRYQGMRMDDPKPTFSYLVNRIKEDYPNLSYIHVVEPLLALNGTADVQEEDPGANDFLRKIWAPRPFISAGWFTPEKALDAAEEKGNAELIAFGRYFISTPDLPARLENNIPLNAYKRETFYLAGDVTGLGYTDYPFASESQSPAEDARL